jgi:hypothetical protein
MEVNCAFGKDGLAVDLLAGYDYRLLETRSALPLADLFGAAGLARDTSMGGPFIGSIGARQALRVDFHLRHHAAGAVSTGFASRALGGGSVLLPACLYRFRYRATDLRGYSLGFGETYSPALSWGTFGVTS